MTGTTKDSDIKPDYLGHRSRLRARFMADEGASMADYELIELLLMMAIPRRDVKPIAKKLLAHYKDLYSLLHAPIVELQENFGLGDSAITCLKLVLTCSLRASSLFFANCDEPVITYWEQFEDYCRQQMAYNQVEEFRVFFFDDEKKYKGEKILSVGTINKTSAPPREIIRAAIEHKAVTIILAHNHPDGNCKPSDADKFVTNQICTVAQAMEIEVFDHLIVTQNEIFSFRRAGIIVPEEKDQKKKPSPNILE
ncbi:MAG: DNA repair protein RadC [Alphaproteobacteria bacterium]|nr:DNA repair protein RadC [Alphaproteobacteria bacterium]